MLQVPCFKCLMFDAFSFQQDDFVAPKLDVGWRYAVEPLMTSLMIAVGDKYLNATCSVPDDHIDPRRSALFMARSVLRNIRDGGANACSTS